MCCSHRARVDDEVLERRNKWGNRWVDGGEEKEIPCFMRMT